MLRLFKRPVDKWYDGYKKCSEDIKNFGADAIRNTPLIHKEPKPGRRYDFEKGYRDRLTIELAKINLVDGPI